MTHEDVENLKSFPSAMLTLELQRRGELDPCIAKRQPGEPVFTLLGRDPVAASLVLLWAAAREGYGDMRFDQSTGAFQKHVVMQGWCKTQCGKEPVDVLDMLPFDMLADAMRKRGASVTPAPCESPAKQ
jgi:hypothetical protein